MKGKMYELAKSKIIDAPVFDENCAIIDLMNQGDTFVVLECLSEQEKETYGRIYKLKLLTSGGHVGYATFWDDEIKIVAYP